MNANIPHAVRQQVERADKLREAAGQQTTPETDVTQVEHPAPPEAEVAVAPAQPEQPVQETEQTVTPVDPQEDHWEHKYKTLQGIHQADLNRARDIAEQNRQLRELLSQMQTPKPEAPQAPAKEYKFVKPEEVEDYGGELLDVAARKAKEEYQPVLDQLQEYIRRLEQKVEALSGTTQRVEQVATMSARDKFFSSLTETVPNWEKLNEDPGFLSWLDSTDDFSGFVRREMFNNALAQFNVPRVAKFFQTYEGAGATPVATPQPESMKPTVPKEQLVTPGKSKGGSAPQGKKFWTHSDIADFYAKARQGVFKGKDAERRALEEDIFAAQREGRIK